MKQTALFIRDDPEEAGIWTMGLYKLRLEVVIADSKEQALEQLQDKMFDLIIINAQCVPMGGIALCRELRGEIANPILILAPRRDEEFVLEAYQAGVDECIPTSIDPRVFLAKVRVWLRHAWTVATASLDNVQVGQLQLDPERRQITLPNGSVIRLTNLEFRLLHLLMAHPGKVMETNLIVDRVWGYTGEDESVVLKNMIYRLRRKIEPDPTQPTFIKTIPGEGYTFRCE